MSHMYVIIVPVNEMIDSIVKVAPAIAICLFALPAYIGVVKQKGWLLGIIIILILGIFAIGFETLAIKTGLPYGNFSYDETLGSKMFGATPWSVAFAYPPILLCAYWIARKFTNKTFAVITITALFATLIDLMLDPAMVKLGFWKWETPGIYYGVPLINFLGWLISSAIGAALLRLFWGNRFVGRSIAYSGIAILLFWTGVNIGIGQRFPALIGLIEAAFVLIFFLIEKTKNNDEPT